MIPALLWWLVIQLFGLAALPLAWRLFGRLPSRGYPLAKILGLLLVSYLLWLGASFHLLSNSVGGILIALVLVGAVSAWLGREGLARPRGGNGLAAPAGERQGDRPLVAWLRANLRLVLATELLFLLVLLAWTAFRSYNPDIAGTEKPMEFAFINGVLGSRLFPPQDPWLSGYAISYYHFGYVMLGVLIRLTGVDPAVGFNLGVALWYALVMMAAFGVAHDLVLAQRGKGGAQSKASSALQSGRGRGIGFGMLGALFVGFLGNLEGLVELAYHRRLVPLAWIEWLDIKQLMDAPPSGSWTGGFWWWWRASRVIHDRDLAGNTIEVIDEFPFFSFLLGDMHPHVLALPFVLLAIALALNLLLGARQWASGVGEPKSETGGAGLSLIGSIRFTLSGTWRTLGAATGLGSAGVILYAVSLGGLAFLNTWDFPIYVGLAALAFGVGLALSNGLHRGVVGRTVVAAAVLAILGWLAYLPFYVGFQSQLGGILPNLLFPTRLSQYFLMFGPFLVVAVLFLLLLTRGEREQRGGEAAEPNGTAFGPVLRKTLALLPWLLLLPLLLMAVFALGVAALPSGRAFLNTVLENPAVRQAVGASSLGGLISLVARVRLASPWTYLFVGGMLAWALAALWARLSAGAGPRAVEQESGGTDEDRTIISWPDGLSARLAGLPIADLFALLLIAVALLLTFVVEFVYLRDLFGTRMNTVFKFYYQAWVMLALASAYGISRLAGRGVPAWLKAPGLLLTAVLVAGGLFYPLAAIPSKADNFRGQPTLDGLAYLRRISPADVAAIEWIRANLRPDAVVLEASGGSYSPEGAGRVSMSTGNPTLLGWDFHERQWRGAAYDQLAAGRPEALTQIYRTARAEELPGLLAKWGVDFVYVGSLERQKYGIGDAALARFEQALGRVYDRDGVRIYAR